MILPLPMALSMLFLALCGCAEKLDTRQLRMQHAADDARMGKRHAAAPPVPLTLEGAIKYAMRNNLDLWAARQERQVQMELTRRSRLEMLPTLMAEAELSRRSRYPANTSVNLTTGRTSLAPSYGAEKSTRRADLALAWNLLDFGVSFLRSRQEEDRMLAAAWRMKRTRAKLRLQVIRAFWKAAACRELFTLSRKIDRGLAILLKSVRATIDQKAISEVEGLKRESTLLEQRLRLNKAEERYRRAMLELSNLLGVPPGTEIKLAEISFANRVDRVHWNIPELEKQAINQRPELYEKDLEERISLTEARVALARMFPSPAAFFRRETDRNELLYYKDWYTTGLQVSWDILRLPKAGQERTTAKARARLAARQRMALALGILTQVHLSVADYYAQIRQYDMVQRISDKRAKLIKAIDRAMAQGKAHSGEKLSAQMQYFRARSQYLMAYANVMTAAARVRHAVGWTAPAAAASPAANHAEAELLLPLDRFGAHLYPDALINRQKRK